MKASRSKTQDTHLRYAQNIYNCGASHEHPAVTMRTLLLALLVAAGAKGMHEAHHKLLGRERQQSIDNIFPIPLNPYFPPYTVRKIFPDPR